MYLELALLAILALNILQSTYALQYPRLLPPPSPSPAKARGKALSTPVPSGSETKRRKLGLSPNVRPPPLQKICPSANDEAATRPPPNPNANSHFPPPMPPRPYPPPRACSTTAYRRPSTSLLTRALGRAQGVLGVWVERGARWRGIEGKGEWVLDVSVIHFDLIRVLLWYLVAFYEDIGLVSIPSLYIILILLI